MNAIFWILIGGVTGWLTGKIIGEEGYGKVFRGGYGKGLDIIFGIIGASFGGYLFFWAVIGGGNSFNRIATAILGSITLVGTAQLISGRYLRSSS